MELRLALDLADRLRAACPVRTGALRMSISRVQGNPSEYVITIGNEQGKEINGQCATVEYAAYTNYVQYLSNGARNRNYHWVNKAVESWVQANRLNFTIREDDVDDDLRDY